jgi:hypothetical protein
MAKCVYSGAETALELVGNEVCVARLHSTAGAMGEAERHVLVALQLIDTAPRDSLPRIVRGHIGEAGFASNRAIRALPLQNWPGPCARWKNRSPSK